MRLQKPPLGAEPGTKYGHMTVERVLTFGRKANVECRCECGAVESRRLSTLKGTVADGGNPLCKECQGKLKSARGLNMFDPSRYMGKRFGRLLVTGVDLDRTRTRNKFRLVCRCDCGAQSLVVAQDLTCGHTTSCGCFHRERQVEVGQQQVRHGHTTFGVLMGHTPIYRAWLKIRAGVLEGWRAGFHKVCHEYDPRWDDFENFLADFGPIGVRETISRHDNQKPWDKSNCFVNIGRRHKLTAKESEK